MIAVVLATLTSSKNYQVYHVHCWVLIITSLYNSKDILKIASTSCRVRAGVCGVPVHERVCRCLASKPTITHVLIRKCGRCLTLPLQRDVNSTG